MGRKPKTGLDFFYTEVNIFDDPKIIDLMDKYGPLGYTVYQVLLTIVYREGYYSEMPREQLIRTVMRTVGNRWCSKSRVWQVILYCAELGLIDETLLLRDSVITSAGLQRRYSAVKVRSSVNKDKYWLLDENEGQAVSGSTPEKSIFAAKMPINVAEMPINAAEKTQKKSKSKVKDIYSVCDYIGKSDEKFEPAAVTHAEEKKLYGTFKNVSLTDEELNKLADAYNGVELNKVIDELSEAVKANPNKYQGNVGWLIRFIKQEIKNQDRAKKKQNELNPPSYDIKLAEEMSKNIGLKNSPP